LRPEKAITEKISWEASYAEMVVESAKDAEWADWDVTANDGLHD